MNKLFSAALILTAVLLLFCGILAVVLQAAQSTQVTNSDAESGSAPGGSTSDESVPSDPIGEQDAWDVALGDASLSRSDVTQAAIAKSPDGFYELSFRIQEENGSETLCAYRIDRETKEILQKTAERLNWTTSTAAMSEQTAESELFARVLAQVGVERSELTSAFLQPSEPYSLLYEIYEITFSTKTHAYRVRADRLGLAIGYLSVTKLEKTISAKHDPDEASLREGIRRRMANEGEAPLAMSIEHWTDTERGSVCLVSAETASDTRTYRMDAFSGAVLSVYKAYKEETQSDPYQHLPDADIQERVLEQLHLTPADLISYRLDVGGEVRYYALAFAERADGTYTKYLCDVNVYTGEAENIETAEVENLPETADRLLPTLTEKQIKRIAAAHFSLDPDAIYGLRAVFERDNAEKTVLCSLSFRTETDSYSLTLNARTGEIFWQK